jgi:hypothetical protein
MHLKKNLYAKTTVPCKNHILIRKEIGLSKEELKRTVQSAYEHRFFYKYGFRDEIIRSFCPYKYLDDCECYKKYIAKSK